MKDKKEPKLPLEKIKKILKMKEANFNPDWLRTFEGFEDIDDVEAEELLETYRTFAWLWVQYYMKSLRK